MDAHLSPHSLGTQTPKQIFLFLPVTPSASYSGMAISFLVCSEPNKSTLSCASVGVETLEVTLQPVPAWSGNSQHPCQLCPSNVEFPLHHPEVPTLVLALPPATQKSASVASTCWLRNLSSFSSSHLGFTFLCRINLDALIFAYRTLAPL